MFSIFTVYKHTSPSGKVYIGITSRDLNRRWANGYGYQTNSHFWRAIQKYGWENFTHETVSSELTKEEACALEIKLISEYDSTNPDKGYNISKGGETPGYGIPCSEEKKEKIRQTRLGEKHWFYGKKLSEEHRRKISEKSRGRRPTEETKLKQKEIATNLRGKSVRCIETNMVYESIAEAARQTNCYRVGIILVLEGKRKTHHGFHWEYV